ncbi:FAD-dependent oxidoreductase [Desulfarculus baarsii]
MIVEALAIGGLGLAAAVGLGVAAKIFAVEVDPLVTAVEEALPGANCGGCGMAGCSAAAAAMAAGRIPPSACVGGGAAVQAEVAKILGLALSASEPVVAHVNCRYATASADVKYQYDGIRDCRAAVLLFGGPKECPVGCLGLGTCVVNCPFGAIQIGANGLPQVDAALCTGCGTCERVCPMGAAGLTSVSNRILREFTPNQCTAPCQRSCPAGIDVARYIDLTAKGRYDDALAVVKERNPLPLICGRICPRPCEAACRRAKVDEPVAIDNIKRFLADHEMQSGKRVQPYKAPAKNRKVAVIGGGAEGLTAAYFLARLGYAPTVFEAGEKLGGMLRTALPAERLPREVLDWEIEGILEMGVEARLNQTFGRDCNLPELFKEGFEAVIMASGGWDAMLSGGKAPRTMPGLHLMLPLKMAWAKGQDIDLGRSVVIVGGGAEALNVARQARQRGAGRALALLRQTREALGLDAQGLLALANEGVDCVFEASVIGLFGGGDRAERLEYVIAGDDDQPQAVEGVSSIIIASGRLPKLIFVRQEADPYANDEALHWRSLRPYGPPERPVVDLFDDLPTVADHRAVVEAIGSGRRAAASAHMALSGRPVAAPAQMLCSADCALDVEALDDLLAAPQRQPMPELAPERRVYAGLEIELGLDERAAKTEASRCLNCGLICYKREGKLPAAA